MSTPSPYQPTRPTGPSADAPMVAPRRPQIRTTLLWVAVVVVLVGSALLSLTAITRETGMLGLVTGSVLAAVPVFPVVATFLWLDRYEAEPPSLLALAFAWGAGVSTFGALVINTASLIAIHNAGGDMTHAAVFVAPFVEEAFKGAAVLLILLMRRREFDGVVDGIVYAGMAGIGFAYVENVLYLGRTLADAGAAARCSSSCCAAWSRRSRTRCSPRRSGSASGSRCAPASRLCGCSRRWAVTWSR